MLPGEVGLFRQVPAPLGGCCVWLPTWEVLHTAQLAPWLPAGVAVRGVHPEVGDWMEEGGFTC